MYKRVAPVIFAQILSLAATIKTAVERGSTVIESIDVFCIGGLYN